MKKILITGASGFLGRPLLSLLLKEEGVEVHAVTLNTSPFLENRRLHRHQVNLLHPQQTHDLFRQVRPTHLLHLAWHAVPRKNWNDSAHLDWLNAGLDLLKNFQAHGGQRAVIAGTSAEYGMPEETCSEWKTSRNPVGLYGTCKNKLRETLDVYSEKKSLEGAWGCLFSLYGPYQQKDALLPQAIRSLLKNETVRCTHGRQIRDFLFIQDAAEAMAALLKSTVTGPVNIASGQPVSVKEMLQKVAQKIDRIEGLNFGSLPQDPDDAPFLLAEIDRLKNEVGWSPRFDLEKGIDLTLEWWKDHPELL